MRRAEQVDEIAARWLLRREEPGWSPNDQAELDAWLESAPEHRVALWRLEYGWSQLDRISVLGSRVLARPRRRRLSPAWRPLAAAAAVLLILAGLGVGVSTWRGGLGARIYATDVGGRQNLLLTDGSRIELDTATRLRTAVGDHARDVWLYSGEAYFEVAHDRTRPFVVHAGDRTVTVVGTKFSVRRDGERVQVSVVEGLVRVAVANPARGAEPVALRRGGIAVAEGRSILVAAPSPERVEAELSWRRGMLTFDQETLAAAAAAFNRYNRKQLVVEGADVASIRIGGAFEANNIDGFARLLSQAYGLKVEDEGAVIKISN